jgi:hypothetical protein
MSAAKPFVPMLPGVAYMPVPRCDQCRKWTRQSATSTLGACGLFTEELLPKVIVLVPASFGCVECERIPEVKP